MSSRTANLGLALTGESAADKAKTLSTWRKEIAGETGRSNMDLIDTAYGNMANAINGLEARIGDAEEAIRAIGSGGATEEELEAIRGRLDDAEEDLSNLTALFNTFRVGARNFIKNTLYFDVAQWTFDSSGYEEIGSYSNADGNVIKFKNEESNIRMWLGTLPIRYGQTCAISFKYKVSSGSVSDINMQIIPLNLSGNAITYTDSRAIQQKGENCGDGWRWVYATYAPPSGTESIRFAFRTGNDYTAYTNTFLIKEFQIELGSTASDWNPAPEDIKAKIHAVEQTIADLDVSKALSDASEAKTLAQTANSNALSAAGNAAEALTLSRTASTNASTALSVANSAQQSASQAAENASASALSANQASADASSSAKSASQAATDAGNAAYAADSSASDAVSAASSAAASARSATTAADNASIAAQNASKSASDASASAQSAASAAADSASAVTTASAAASDASNALSAVNNKDSVPTQGSDKLVSSGGVWSVITNGKPWNVSYTITEAGWSGSGPFTQIINDGGVTARTVVIASPANEASANAIKSGILITPSDGKLTFSTTKKPDNDISLALTMQYSAQTAIPFYVSKKGGGGNYDEMTEFEIVDGVFDNITDLPNMLILKDGNVTGVFGASFNPKTIENESSIHALTVPDGYRPFVAQNFTGRQWDSGNTEWTIPVSISKDGIVEITNNSGSSLTLRRMQFFETWIRRQDQMIAEFYKEADKGPSDLVFNVNQIIADTVNNKVTYKLDASYSTYDSGPAGNFTVGIRLPEGFGPLVSTDIIATFRLSDGTTKTAKYFYLSRNATYLSLFMSSTSVGFSFELTTDLYQENANKFTSFNRTNVSISTNWVEINPDTGKIRFQLAATFDATTAANYSYGTEIGFGVIEYKFKPKTLPGEYFNGIATKSNGEQIAVQCSLRGSSSSYACSLYVKSLDTGVAYGTQITGITIDYTCDAYGY